MDTVIKHLQDLVAIPSVNPMGVITNDPIYSTQSLVDHLAQSWKRLGADVQVFRDDPLQPNFMARFDFKAPETIILDAHLDTVSHLEMSIAPFEPEVKNELLYGRGSCDTKSNFAVYHAAIASLLKRGTRFSKNVIILGCSDEEFSFSGIQRLKKENIKADYALIGEPTRLEGLRAHKGVMRFNLQSKGHACHSSTPELGRNAIYSISKACLNLEAYHQEIQKRKHPILGSPSLSVGMIKGGTTVNTVPPSAQIQIDRRLIPGENPDEVFAEIAERFKHDPDIELETPYVQSTGYEQDDKSAMVQEMKQCCSKHQHELKDQFANFATHGPFYQEWGIPSLVFGPGSIHKAHSKDEYVPISELKQSVEFLKTLLSS